MEINGYENYLIYPSGKVWSKASKRYLLGRDNGNGYLQVCLYKDGISKNMNIHRLVAEHYIPNPYNKKCIDHMNRIRTDNRVENLRWATHSENNDNKGVQKNNKTTGIKNICYNKRDDIYTYQKTIRGQKHQKSFKTLEDAIQYKINYEKNL